MPNWCECEIQVTGDPKQLIQLGEWLEALGKQSKDADTWGWNISNALEPYPERFASLDQSVGKRRDELMKQLEPYKGKSATDVPSEIRSAWSELCNLKDGFNSGGCEWCKEHWGTKWGIGSFNYLYDKERFHMSFLSAWTEPRPLINLLSKKFPTLGFEMTYKEESLKYYGLYSVTNGEIVHDQEMEYPEIEQLEDEI